MRATGNSNIPAGTQTLMRGMAIVEAVARGAATLKDIGVAIGCTRSTTHRLIQSLAQAGFLSRDRKIGYALGPRLVELGTLARDRSPLLSVALPHLQTHQRRARAGDPVSRKDRKSAWNQDAVEGGLQDAACTDRHGQGVVA